MIALLLAACSSSPPVPDPGRAAPPTLHHPERVALVAIGDTGRGSPEQRRVAAGIARVCAERPCDALLLLGDNLYPTGMDTPDDPRMDAVTTAIYGSLGLPVYLALGNHDHGNSGGQPHKAAWQVAWANRTKGVHLPSAYYAFKAGPAEVFVLDTTAIFWGSEAEQQAWLQQAIDASSARFKVVMGHHPFRSNGDHGNAGRYDGVPPFGFGDGSSLKRLFDSQLCQRVDLYLAGHDHNRQWIQHCGVDLVVSGAGASARRLVDRGNQTRFEAATTGLAWIALGPEGTQIEFFDADGKHEPVAHDPKGRPTSQ